MVLEIFDTRSEGEGIVRRLPLPQPGMKKKKTVELLRNLINLAPQNSQSFIYLDLANQYAGSF